ncbi:hypothetical protein TNCV_2839261 [Trichonephila clavipes]|nr:hypothetical protein TNCV_2839261 [Trichonephila clavipes]
MSPSVSGMILKRHDKVRNVILLHHLVGKVDPASAIIVYTKQKKIFRLYLAYNISLTQNQHSAFLGFCSKRLRNHKNGYVLTNNVTKSIGTILKGNQISGSINENHSDTTNHRWKKKSMTITTDPSKAVPSRINPTPGKLKSDRHEEWNLQRLILIQYQC